jgi:hypothetical protein
MPTIAQNTYKDVMVSAPFLQAEEIVDIGMGLHVFASGTYKRVSTAAPNVDK